MKRLYTCEKYQTSFYSTPLHTLGLWCFHFLSKKHCFPYLPWFPSVLLPLSQNHSLVRVQNQSRFLVSIVVDRYSTVCPSSLPFHTNFPNQRLFASLLTFCYEIVRKKRRKNSEFGAFCQSISGLILLLIFYKSHS